MSTKRNIIRVYGVIFNDHDEVLVSDEFRFGMPFTKFPGGGLEFGESLPEALNRELMEELQLDLSIGELFYFNEHAQVSKFNPDHQIFSFYYLVNGNKTDHLFRDAYEIPLRADGEKQRWVHRTELTEDLFTFPIDRLVARKLIERD